MIRRFAPSALLLPLLLFVNGCGGLTGGSADITGTVLDINNNPARGATVTGGGRTTTTTASGAYQLQDVNVGEIEVVATIDQDGTDYRGRTTTLTFANEQTDNVNIMVVPEGERARVFGTVRDGNGFVLEDASVWAYAGVGSAQRAITDSNGDYELEDMAADIEYTIQANARTYKNDQAIVTLDPGDDVRIDFALSQADNPALFPPTNTFAITWVTPTDLTRAQGGISPYERIRQIIDKERYIPPADRIGDQTRLREDLIAEVDLFWDAQNFADLLGYGIYRGTGATGSVSEHDFIGNPTADYYVDIGVNTGSTYSYAVSTISGNFPDFSGTESALSDRIVATLLELLELRPLTQSPLTFSWDGGSQADLYIVFLFDEFPGIQVDPIWSNEQNPTSSLSYTYDGPSLQQGATYWYLVLGVSNDFNSRTISQIDSFVR